MKWRLHHLWVGDMAHRGVWGSNPDQDVTGSVLHF